MDLMQRLVLGCIFVILIVIFCIFVFSSHSNASGQRSMITPVVISVVDGKLSSGPRWVQVYEGDTVALSFLFDTSGTLYLHGYEKRVKFEKGKPVRLIFAASASGRFIYEIEQTHTEIGMLEVLPNY